jgi:GntR family L-lactate dehydrogenase operon transcriptional regulator
MMINTANARDLDRSILKLVAETDRPIGQGALNLLLRKQGFEVSSPTVGRKLQSLEFDGLLRKAGVDGRVLTGRGREVLKVWDTDMRLRTLGEMVLEVLKRGDKRNILNLLQARRLLEREAAALATEQASSGAILQMERILTEQSRAIQRGDLGIAQDVSFHVEIAKATKNPVIYSLVSLLRNNDHYNFVVTSMRAVTGGQLVVEHRAILDGIVNRKPNAARTAMDRHLRNLTVEIDKYWERWMARKNSRVI